MIFPDALHTLKKGSGQTVRYRTIIFDPVLLYGYKGSFYYEKYYRTFAKARPSIILPIRENAGKKRQWRICPGSLPISERPPRTGSCWSVSICSVCGCCCVKICLMPGGRLITARRNSSAQPYCSISCMNITGRNSPWSSLRPLPISAKGSAAVF